MGRSGRICLGVTALFFGASSHAVALESPQPIGYFCSPTTTSIVDNQYYAPQSGTCTYLSPTIPGTVSRYGDLYRGTVGSSTILNGHLMSFQSASTQFGDVISNPQQGEDFFAAIFPSQFLTEFRTFFQKGIGNPVGTNYGFIRFKYGTPPPPAPTLSFSASSSTIESGQNSTLSWIAANATSCSASNGWSGSRPVSGSEIVSPHATTTFELACTGAGGAVSASTTINVMSQSKPDPVIIIPGILGSEKHNDEWVIDPILHTYDDLIATLDINYYTPDVDLFTFPYDWRKSNVDTAVLLKQKIDEVKAICQCAKVDLVAHSMGGLVARQYIQSDAYDHDVDQLIFLGTPHLGAPKAYLMWEGGEVGPALRDRGMELILEHEAYEKHYPSLFAYLRTEPIESVRQLLPIYDYIFDNNAIRQYPSNYPVNDFLKNLNDNISRLLDSDIKIYNFVGETNTQETINGIKAVITQHSPLWEHGYPEGFYENSGIPGLINGSGDETVPTASAAFVNSHITLISSEHTTLPSQAEGNIYEILTDTEPVTLIHNLSHVNARLILIKILSPADLLVIAPDNTKIGKENGQEINQIPGAFYTGFNTDTEYITILNPLDGEYKVVTQGTGSGSYTVETNYISEATTTAASFSGTTSPGKVTELTLEVDTAHPEELEIIPPDLDPPVITITQPLAKDYLRSEQLPLAISASDAKSGILGLESRLDDVVIPNVGQVDLFFKALRSHSITASSTDMVGNATTSVRAFRVTANATSTVSDIERTYSLGWTTKKIQDDLKKKLNSCNVKKTTITNVTKVVTTVGKNGKPTTKTVQEKVTKVEIVFDKNCAKAMLKELDKYRNKGLNEQAYQLLKEDVQWLVNN